MLYLVKLLPHLRPLFSCGDNGILSQTVFEGIAVLAVKQTHPARLLAQVLQDRVVLLCETDCSAWRPEKASIDNVSFFVNAVEAD